MGARFDQWIEHFNRDVWKKAFEELQFDYNPYLYSIREHNDIFPWDHIETGISKERLWTEYAKAMADSRYQIEKIKEKERRMKKEESSQQSGCTSFERMK